MCIRGLRGRDDVRRPCPPGGVRPRRGICQRLPRGLCGARRRRDRRPASRPRHRRSPSRPRRRAARARGRGGRLADVRRADRRLARRLHEPRRGAGDGHDPHRDLASGPAVHRAAHDGDGAARELRPAADGARGRQHGVPRRSGRVLGAAGDHLDRWAGSGDRRSDPESARTRPEPAVRAAGRPDHRLVVGRDPRRRHAPPHRDLLHGPRGRLPPGRRHDRVPVLRSPVDDRPPRRGTAHVRPACRREPLPDARRADPARDLHRRPRRDEHDPVHQPGHRAARGVHAGRDQGERRVVPAGAPPR